MRSRRRTLAGVALAICAVSLTACGGGGSNVPTRPGAVSSQHAPSGTTITISNFMFSPMSLRVAPGTTITVINRDSASHTLTATDGTFDTGNIAQNESRTIKAPTKPGTYGYICNIHQYMTGSLVVT